VAAVDPTLPATLGEAIATEPLWLRAWLVVLGGANLAAVLFAVGREGGRWRLRPEPLAIIAAFVAAAVFMDWLYARVGYVRLLGLAHLVCWTPAWIWLLRRRRALDTGSWLGRYVRVWLVVAGISLAIDAVDVIRHLLGDGELLYRWGRPPV
jgi:hypothetical protein